MKNYRLSILGGCGSSGTTLLTHLLSKHPDIASGPEFNCFNHFEIYDFQLFKKNYKNMFNGQCSPWGYVDIHVFMTYREQYGIELKDLSKWVEESRNTDEFFEKLCSHMCSRFNGNYFVEKSPTNVYSFKILAETYPDIPIVHLVRDGRDVAASLMKRGFNLYFAGTRWLYDTLCGLNGRGSKSYLEVNYETLVSSPEKILQNIFAHLGVEPEKYNEKKENHGKAIYQEDWLNRKEPRVWNQTPADPISTASVGKYKTVFTKKELSTLYRITLTKRAQEYITTDINSFGELIEYLGYNDRTDAEENKTISTSLGEKYLELQDFYRRLLRYRNNGRLSIPKRYSIIK